MTYSQNGEEKIILDIFRDSKSGWFLDIGAYDFAVFSNTRALADKNWSGVLVECSPYHAAKLLDQTRTNPRMNLICAAVGAAPAALQHVWHTKDAVSTTERPNYEKWKDNLSEEGKFQSMFVSVITISDILRVFSGPFDFISIDTEGTSFAIAKTLPMASLKPKALCIEHDGRSEEVSIWGAGHGYSPAFLDGNNIILKRDV